MLSSIRVSDVYASNVKQYLLIGFCITLKYIIPAFVATLVSTNDIMYTVFRNPDNKNSTDVVLTLDGLMKNTPGVLPSHDGAEYPAVSILVFSSSLTLSTELPTCNSRERERHNR